MKTESRWIQTNKAHRQDNTAGHSSHFPAGSYLVPRGKGATTTATMEWKNGLVIALMRGYSQLLSSSPAGCLAPLPPLSKGPTYLSCHRPSAQIFPFSLLPPSHTSQHPTTLPCYMVQPWPDTPAAQFSLTDISWIQQDRSSCFSSSSSSLLLQAPCHLPGTASHQEGGIGPSELPGLSLLERVLSFGLFLGGGSLAAK